MARSNHLTLTGNLGATPELKQTDTSNFVVFPLYTQNSYFDEASQSYKRSDKVDIHDVIVFDGSKAFQMAQRLEKGDFIELSGKLSYTKRAVKVEDPSTGTLQDINLRIASVKAYEIDLIFLAKDKDLPDSDPSNGDDPLY